MKRQIPYLLLILGLAALDQASKAVIVGSIPFYGSVRVIPGFFNLTHIHNKGGIFGLFNDSPGAWPTLVLAGLALAALAAIATALVRTPSSRPGTKIALAVLLAGALGNQIDRLVRGYVVDWVEWYVGRFHWPTFNVADACITLGALGLAAALAFRRPHASGPD